MSGEESHLSAYAAEFAERLRDKTGIPVSYWDERLTSREAERVLRQAKASVERRKQAVDKLAAMLLLESYLDARRYSAGGPVD